VSALTARVMQVERTEAAALEGTELPPPHCHDPRRLGNAVQQMPFTIAILRGHISAADILNPLVPLATALGGQDSQLMGPRRLQVLAAQAAQQHLLARIAGLEQQHGCRAPKAGSGPQLCKDLACPPEPSAADTIKAAFREEEAATAKSVCARPADVPKPRPAGHSPAAQPGAVGGEEGGGLVAPAPAVAKQQAGFKFSLRRRTADLTTSLHEAAQPERRRGTAPLAAPLDLYGAAAGTSVARTADEEARMVRTLSGPAASAAQAQEETGRAGSIGLRARQPSQEQAEGSTHTLDVTFERMAAPLHLFCCDAAVNADGILCPAC
jgi:hypothetical protein